MDERILFGHANF